MHTNVTLRPGKAACWVSQTRQGCKVCETRSGLDREAAGRLASDCIHKGGCKCKHSHVPASCQTNLDVDAQVEATQRRQRGQPFESCWRQRAAHIGEDHLLEGISQFTLVSKLLSLRTSAWPFAVPGRGTCKAGTDEE